MKNSFAKLTVTAVLAFAAVSARAGVIIQNTGGTGTTAPFFVGESFKTPTDFLYYNLTFNFYSNVPATSPEAAGTAFLLSAPYSGTPSALSTTTAGFLTESTSSTGGDYAFNPSFVLLAGTTYYLYTNAAMSISGGNSFPNATTYLASDAASDFGATFSTANFSLNGNAVGVPLPEPSSQTALYVLSGAVGLGFVVMRRRRPLA